MTARLARPVSTLLAVVLLALASAIVGPASGGASAAAAVADAPRAGTVGSKSSASAADGALLDRYAPVVVVRPQRQACSDGEPYLPVAADSVLGRADVVLRGPDGGIAVRGPRAEDLADKPDGYFLDLPGDPLTPGCDYEKWFDGYREETPVAVHGRVGTDSDHPGQIVAQYWFWWVFNDWNDKHEGDWEMVQIVFPATTAARALRTTPTSVAFAQHEGSEVVSWNDPRLHRDGDHVAVYPSVGSHAAYTTQAQWYGKSASAGFGCDDTALKAGEGAELLRPEVIDIGTDPPAWLTFAGRWGQRAPSFNNGPTGPAMKPQWAHPITWMQDSGRPDAVALPTLPSAAQEMFCSLSAAGSTLFVAVLSRPWLAAVLLAGAVVVGAGLVRLTEWRGGPRQLAATRAAGQILIGPWRVLAQRPVAVLVPAALMAAALGVGAAVRQRAVQTGSDADLAAVGAPSTGLWGIAALVLAYLVVPCWVAAMMVATTRALRARMGDGVASVDDSGSLARSAWVFLGSYLVIAVSAALVLTLPLATWWVAKWAVAAPASVCEGLSIRVAWARSSSLTAGRRWRALAITLALGWLSAVPGPIVGAVLLVVTPLPFLVVNTITVVLIGLGLALGAVGMLLHYLDLLGREAEEESVR